ncbi:MarR family transcriptional regulator [Sulfolobus sp. S-194]|uniref:MarR family transcriptional regulator n=1 Tax=Sulfolobus sp. S-194 TaxID=2512240 RepID=UPI001436E671|nr:MarR family transcriptional regulator [Sulfolobus sp. S-194]QIW23502.1 MarR family transcriptional regulator [Sulfolobus sp. S-194]
MNLRDKVLAYLFDKRSATAEEIADRIKEEVDYVQATLRVLENEKLVRKVKKGFIKKHDAYELTPTGLEEAEKAYEKVQNKASELQQIVQGGGEIPEDYIDLIPLMTALSLIETMMLEDIILFDIFNNM